MPTENGKARPQPSKKNLLKDGAGGRGGDGAGTGPKQAPPSTSRTSVSSRPQMQQLQAGGGGSAAPSLRGDRRSQHSGLQQSAKGHPSSTKLNRGQGSRPRVSSPVQLPPGNTAARGQCRRLRSCVACSGKVTPESPPAAPSTPPIPAEPETEPPPFVHQLTQTDTLTPQQQSVAALELVDEEIQTERPFQEQRRSRIPLFMDRDAQTETPVQPPSRGEGAEPSAGGQQHSLFRRLLRACCCSHSAAQPQQLGTSAARAQHPAARLAAVGPLMAPQETIERIEWAPYSWPWLIETSL